MAYMGNNPAEIYSSVQKQTITGDGTVGPYTLDYSVTNANEISVFVNNVRQEPGTGKAYTVSGDQLTMTGTVASTDDFYVIFSGLTQGTITPPDASVTTAKIADDAVTTAKLASPVGIETTSSTFKMTDLTSNAFYRTGTWTPDFSSAGATNADVDPIFTSGSYTNQYGHYVRIGDIIHAFCRLRIGSSVTYQNGGANSQGLSVVGFPFNVKTNSDYYPMSSVAYFDTNHTGWTGYSLSGYMQQTEKKSCKLTYSGTSGNNTDTPFLTNHFNNGHATSDFYFNITYCTDDA